MALLRLAIVANMLKIMSMETISFQKEAQSVHTHTCIHTKKMPYTRFIFPAYWRSNMLAFCYAFLWSGCCHLVFRLCGECESALNANYVQPMHKMEWILREEY